MSIRSSWSTCQSNPLFFIDIPPYQSVGGIIGFSWGWDVDVGGGTGKVWTEFRSPHSQGRGFALTKLPPRVTLVFLFYRQGVEGDKQT